MKLLRFGERGAERPGLVGPSGEIRDLSPHIDDISGDVLGAEGLQRIRQIEIDALSVVEGQPRLGPPVADIPNLIAIGLNYADHAREAGMEIPEEPVIFSKSTSCISGPNDDVVMPHGSRRTDWEVEIAFVMGSRAKNVTKENALSHVAGYCICNDVSQRDWQLESTGQWIKGKSHETFGPLGPWLVTIDEIPDPQALDIFLEVNGERMQSSNTNQMIFPIVELVSIVSTFMTLLPG
ncbi:MAG: fumarylacetoacetate hydrolase family protein, partial [Methyloligellaceae bacterium]